MVNFLIKSKFNLKKALIYKKAYEKITDWNLFDEEFYKNHYPYNGEPLTHYLFDGYKKGYEPSINFNGFEYLNTYENVKSSGLNPLVHYALYGIEEGKETFASNFLIKERIESTNSLYLNNYEFEEEPLVSIIILNRNGLNHLKRLFKDFKFKTNYSNFEVILIDNDSTDESVSYIESLNVDFPIKIIDNDENLSFSIANNKGVEESNGEYVLLLNNDIEPTYGWLNEMMGTILNNENVAAVGAKLVFPYYGTLETSHKSFKIQHSGDIFAFNKNPVIYAYNRNSLAEPFNKKVNETKKVVAVTAACILIKKSVFNEVNGLDEGYVYGYEDVDFSLKLNRAGYDVYYCSTALLFHHEASTRIIDNNFKSNSGILIESWHDYLTKNIYLDKIENNKFFCEKPLRFLLIDYDFKHAENLKDGNLNKVNNNLKIHLAREVKEKEYEFEFANADSNILVNGLTDILISFLPNVNMNDIDARENAIKILFMIENYEIKQDLSSYDLIITNQKSVYGELNESNVHYIDSDYLENILKLVKEHVLIKYECD